MVEIIPYIVTSGGSIGVYVISKLIYNGLTNGRKKPNGSMTEAKCDTKMTEVRKEHSDSTEKLHEKINEAISGISEINGYLRGSKEN